MDGPPPVRATMYGREDLAVRLLAARHRNKASFGHALPDAGMRLQQKELS